MMSEVELGMASDLTRHYLRPGMVNLVHWRFISQTVATKQRHIEK